MVGCGVGIAIIGGGAVDLASIGFTGLVFGVDDDGGGGGGREGIMDFADGGNTYDE